LFNFYIRVAKKIETKLKKIDDREIR
jgi:hypothetical protein